METINAYQLHKQAKGIAAELYAEGLSHSDGLEQGALEYAQDMALEAADNHEWAIYTYKALLLCAECDTSEGEQWIEGTGQTFTDIGDHACAVAGATLYSAIYEAIEAIHGGTQRL